MSYIDFMSVVHKATKRDYLARVNEPEFPKAKAAAMAKKWAFDYWDGDRRINYGGYRYMEGRWEKVAKAMADHYGIKAGDRILDVGCGKGFLMFDWTKVVPGAEVFGIDISDYAIENGKEEVKDRMRGVFAQHPAQPAQLRPRQGAARNRARRQEEQVHLRRVLSKRRGKDQSALLAGDLRGVQLPRGVGVVVQVDGLHWRPFLHLFRVTSR